MHKLIYTRMQTYNICTVGFFFLFFPNISIAVKSEQPQNSYNHQAPKQTMNGIKQEM